MINHIILILPPVIVIQQKKKKKIHPIIVNNLLSRPRKHQKDKVKMIFYLGQNLVIKLVVA